MRRKAGMVQICGLPFTVYVGDDKGIPELRGSDPEHHNDGYTDAPGCKFYIRHGLARAYAHSVLEHECFHAVWYHCSVEQIIAATDLEHIEESFILATVTALGKAFADARKVRL